ncbi:MAG: zf-HC2 domain-containing protein [Myxococcota bacterium]|nr:zf-HC2 domain-containing protein [Myxococcota bacterium]
MMDCSHFSASLPFFLNDELEAEQRAELLAHAENCPGCGGDLSIDQALREGLRQTSIKVSSKAPACLHTNIRRGFSSARMWRVGSGLGGLTAAAAVASFMLLPSGDPLDPLIETTIEYQARRLPADIAFEPPAKIEAFLAKQLGRSVALPNIPELPVRAARFMPTQGRRGAMILLGGGAQQVDVLAVEADAAMRQRLPKSRIINRRGREVLQWQRDGVIFSATGANGRAPKALFHFANHSR